MTKSLSEQAMEARRGTDDVKEHFVRILGVGSPSIADLAYAVKSRVKDDYKIEEKVRRKRSEGKSSYKTTDIRDLVGIRIVTLYRLDALSILPVLLRLISENSGPEETKFFLNDPIEEVIIYSVNPSGDAQKLALRINSVFSLAGHGGKCKIQERPENYSSVHIVVWARGKYRQRYVEVPVEVQVRTAMEDVWAEMDHQLKYKRKNEDEVDTQTTAMIANCLAHLNVLKTLNDGVAQYGDQVKIQLDELDDSIRRVSRVRLAEEPERRLVAYPEYEGMLKAVIQDVLGRSREASNEADGNSHRSTQRISCFKEAIRGIEAARDHEALDGLEQNLANEVDYVLGMEEALLNYEIGRRLGSSAGNEFLIQADFTYRKMLTRYPDRGIVLYRLARVSYQLGDIEGAKQTLRRLIDDFHTFDLDENHWVRASANRLLGFLLWNGVRRKANDRGGANDPEDRRAIKEAAVCSYTASTIPVSEPNHPNEHPTETQRVMALSNLLFFTIEFLEAGGSWSELESADLTQEIFNEALAEVSQFDESAPTDYHKLNTLRRVHLFRGEMERARHFAELAVENLEKAGFVDRGSQSEPEFVLRECLKTVAL
jgi:ppGpp synthetase/RelA/SpoT-type nucleotidyltranferase